MSEGRSVLQQCVSAKLMVKPSDGENAAEYVTIGQGVVMFICFLKDATNDTVEKMARSLLNVRLSSSIEGDKRVSILDLPGDILIVPQATLGGKVKGKAVQYHNNIQKEKGESLYHQFVALVESQMKNNPSSINKNVKFGTYGNLQVLSMETNGPYTHIIDF